MRMIALAAAAALAAPLAFADGHGIIAKESPHDVATTLDRIEAAVTNNGGKVFVRLDHAAAAEEYGKSLPPTQVLVFGNPAVGTGLMQKHPEVSIDLPLKVGAYEDADGKVFVIFRDPASYMPTHGLPAEGVRGTLDKLTDRAVAAE